MPKTTPLVKGVFTGLLIVGSMLLLASNGVSAETPAGYLPHILYCGGVGWAIYEYVKSPAYTGKFGGLFNTGFRCFIIVTLIMVIYSVVFYSANPEIKEDMAVKMTEDLKAQKELMPDQITERVAGFKKGFMTTIISLTIFQYLLLGVLFTAACSIFALIFRKPTAHMAGPGADL